jgi:hypothetical protein
MFSMAIGPDNTGPQNPRPTTKAATAAFRRHARDATADLREIPARAAGVHVGYRR